MRTVASSPEPQERRRSSGTAAASLLAAAMALPVAAGAAGLLAVEAYRAVRPASVLFVPPPSPSFAEALRSGEVEAAHAFVRAGADVNHEIPFSDPVLTGGRAIAASPLAIAVAAGNGSAALMLVAFGASLDLPQNAGAICLAREAGNAELAHELARGAGLDTEPPCPPGGGELAGWARAGAAPAR